MNPKHRELEVKISAGDVSVHNFNHFFFLKEPSKYLHIIGPDRYYTQGSNIVRHRLSGGAGELTVKQRKSSKSTRDRLEIDLQFSEGQTPEDVTAFLLATGWKQEFTVVKDAHIFWFDGSRRMPGVEAVIYDVRLLANSGEKGAPRRFVEFEVHKEDSSHPMALSTLRDYEASARSAMPLLGPVVNESLYEIYSGRRYGMVRK